MTADKAGAQPYDPEIKCQSIQYCHKTSFPSISNPGFRIKKIMITEIFLKICNAVIQVDVLEPSTTVKSDNSQTLKQLLSRSQSARRKFCCTITVLGLTRHPRDKCKAGSYYLPYCPHLTPGDFHLFPKSNKQLCGHLFESNEEVENTLRP